MNGKAGQKIQLLARSVNHTSGIKKRKRREAIMRKDEMKIAIWSVAILFLGLPVFGISIWLILETLEGLLLWK